MRFSPWTLLLFGLFGFAPSNGIWLEFIADEDIDPAEADGLMNEMVQVACEEIGGCDSPLVSGQLEVTWEQRMLRDFEEIQEQERQQQQSERELGACPAGCTIPVTGKCCTSKRQHSVCRYSCSALRRLLEQTLRRRAQGNGRGKGLGLTKDQKKAKNKQVKDKFIQRADKYCKGKGKRCAGKVKDAKVCLYPDDPEAACTAYAL